MPVATAVCPCADRIGGPLTPLGSHLGSALGPGLLFLPCGVIGATGGGDVREVCLGPVREGAEDRHQGAAQVADLVLDPRGDFRVVGADDHAVAFQLAQALGEDLGGDGRQEPL